MNGMSHYNWKEGAGLTLTAGLFSKGNSSGNLLFDFPVEAQYNNKELRAHLTFALGALLKLPSHIYFEDGKLYLVTAAPDNDALYASKVEVIDLANELANLVPSLAGKKIDTDKIFRYLAQVALESTIKNSTTEDGIERVELFLPKDIVQKISRVYNSLIAKAKEADLGAMGAIVSQLLGLFEFNLDDVIVRADYIDNKLISFSLRLTNYSTSAAGAGKDESVIIELKDIYNLASGTIEKNLMVPENGLAAMEASKDVRAMVDKVISQGLTNIGESFYNNLLDIEAAYNDLSKEAQYTVMNFADFIKIKEECEKLTAECKKFLEALVVVEDLAKAEGNEQAIFDLFNKTLNPLFNKFDYRQKEYLGQYAIDKYLEMRDANEKNYLVNHISTLIDDLTVENYPTSKEMNKAITDIKALYESLLEDNKALVLNYDKVSEAEKLARSLEIDEINKAMKDSIDRINTFTDETTYQVFNKEKTNITNILKQYEAATEEEKSLFTNYNDFVKATDKFYETVEAAFLKAYKKIGGIDKVVAGDECYNLINDANTLKNLLNADQKTALKAELDDLAKCVTEHRNLEVNAVKDLISKIGEVSFTKECHDKIVAAREAYVGIRKAYANFVNNRMTLQAAEVDYIKLSIGDLTVDTVTAKDAAILQEARSAYEEATSAYKVSHLNFFRNGIINKLKDFMANLEEIEEKIKN